LCLRLIRSWNPRTKRFCALLTNLPPPRAYKGRFFEK